MGARVAILAAAVACAGAPCLFKHLPHSDATTTHPSPMTTRTASRRDPSWRHLLPIALPAALGVARRVVLGDPQGVPPREPPLPPGQAARPDRRLVQVVAQALGADATLHRGGRPRIVGQLLSQVNEGGGRPHRRPPPLPPPLPQFNATLSFLQSVSPRPTRSSAIRKSARRTTRGCYSARAAGRSGRRSYACIGKRSGQHPCGASGSRPSSPSAQVQYTSGQARPHGRAVLAATAPHQ